MLGNVWGEIEMKVDIMETVDNCERCAALEWDSEDFAYAFVFSCADCSCYYCEYLHNCAGQCLS